MQSKQINLELMPSKIPLIALIIIFTFSYLISHYASSYRYIAFGIFVSISLFWLIKYLTFKKYRFSIDTETKMVKLWQNDQFVPAHFKKQKSISWWLTIIHLQVHNKNFKIFLFIDSVQLNLYKSFKVFSRWT